MALIRRQMLDEQLMSPKAGGSHAVGAGPAAPVVGQSTQAPMGQEAGGFINLQQYLDANKGQGAAMADKAFGDVEGRANQFGAVVTPTNENEANALTSGVQAVGNKAGLAGSWGGRDTQLNKTFGAGGQYSQGERDRDNAMMGHESGGRLGELSSKYGALASKVFTPKAPPVGATPVNAPVVSAAPLPAAPVQAREPYQESEAEKLARKERVSAKNSKNYGDRYY